jgi:hypothetical protein
MVSDLKECISDYLYNFRSKKVDQKIIVIESDDWCSVRTSSKQSYEYLLNRGYKVDQCPFNRNDQLETNQDIECLTEVLQKHKGNDGRTAIITANALSGNPDFEQIRSNEFHDYFWEPFVTTYQRNTRSDQVYTLLQKANEIGAFRMQFHGMEHVHVNNWMKALRSGERRAIDGIERNMFTVSGGLGSNCKNEYLDAWGIYNQKDHLLLKDRISKGLDQFYIDWGYKSETAIAPCYIWSDEVENICVENRIRVLQSGKAQLKSDAYGRYQIVRHITGERNKRGMMYYVRNVSFEPSVDEQKDWVGTALKSIERSFRLGAPAIINSHRVNYMGGIHIKNRDNGLQKLDALLSKIIKKWPQVVFRSSDELLKEIK